MQNLVYCEIFSGYPGYLQLSLVTSMTSNSLIQNKQRLQNTVNVRSQFTLKQHKQNVCFYYYYYCAHCVNFLMFFQVKMISYSNMYIMNQVFVVFVHIILFVCLVISQLGHAYILDPYTSRLEGLELQNLFGSQMSGVVTVVKYDFLTTFQLLTKQNLSFVFYCVYCGLSRNFDKSLWSKYIYYVFGVKTTNSFRTT